MPSKRTRSAAVAQPDGNSSNVTDYLGPPATKRKKSAAAPPVTASTRVTRSAEGARVSAEEPQTKAPATRRMTRQQRVEEDDDDGPVHVAFNRVSSAVNEARLGRPRTINGLQPAERQAGLSGTTGDTDEEGENEPASARKRGRTVRTKQKSPPQNQQSRPNTRLRARLVGSADGVHVEPTPRQEGQQRQRQTPGRGSSTGKSAPLRKRQQTQEQPEDDATSTSGDEGSEQDIQDAADQAAEDSAFIDAPGPEESLPEVKRAFRSLGGIIKTLSHPAWTGVKNWDEDPDMACSTRTAGKLIEYLRQLNDLLLDSCDARYERNANGNMAVTINFLRRNNAKLKALFAYISVLVDQICTRKLAAVDNLGARGVQTRKRFLCDITKRIVPMLVLVIQKAYEVGPSEEKGSDVHLTLNSFTIQFPLRTIGWATRLAEALSRGLVKWPIDVEFDRSDGELDTAELAHKQEKINKRERFAKQLESLYVAVKKAADAIEREARLTTQMARQDQDRRRVLLIDEQRRRQAMIRGRELWAKREQERQEADQLVAQQMNKFAQASQNLKPVPNPLAEMWKQAVQAGHGFAASQASSSNGPVPSPRQPKDKERALPQSENEDDFFLINDTKGHPYGRPVQNDHVSSTQRAQHGALGTRTGLQNGQAAEAWGAPRWSKEEEKRLVLRMQSDGQYTPSTMALRLGRSDEDVARKAAELKAVYRAIYTKREVDIPAWAC